MLHHILKPPYCLKRWSTLTIPSLRPCCTEDKSKSKSTGTDPEAYKTKFKKLELEYPAANCGLLWRLSHAEVDLAQVNIDQLALKKDFEATVKCLHKYKILLGLRSEIEFLPTYLWPPGVEKPQSRREVWTTLLVSKDKEFAESPRIQELRKNVKDIKKMSALTFVNNIIILYGEFRDNVAHRVKLPSSVTPDTIDSVLDLLNVRKHTDLRYTIEVIITPIKSVDPPLKESPK